jgi:predicted ribosome quality control (RQC) complex YloA/Tae2 family protein
MSDATKTDIDIAPLAASARRKIARALAKQRRLIANLHGDLEKHGEPERWKRYGDLLLANLSSAVRDGDRISVADYFAEGAPTIQIEGDENKTIAEIAEGYFRLFTKARNGLRFIHDRMSAAEAAAARLESELAAIDQALEANDAEFLLSLAAPAAKKKPVPKKKKIEAAFKGARRFLSSDGIEILVGKKAIDNDFLTFRIARSQDLWLHAADYPGSHVVVRLAGRKEAPHSTLIEAAQLAAFYSDARGQATAAVRHTQKKFVNKPRKSAPGLVSLSSFRTILVEPAVPGGIVRPDK